MGMIFNAFCTSGKQIYLFFSLHMCMPADPLNVVERTPYLGIDLNKNRSASLFALVWVDGGYTANLTTEFQLENGLDKLTNVTAVEMESLSDSLVRIDVVFYFFSGFETAERLTVNLTWVFHLFGPEGHSVLASTLLDFEASTLPPPSARTGVSSGVILAVTIPLVVLALVLSAVLSSLCVLHRRRAAVEVTKPPVSDIRKLFQQVASILIYVCTYRCVYAM